MSKSKNGKRIKIFGDVVLPIFVSVSSGSLLWLLNLYSNEFKILINSTWIYILSFLGVSIFLITIAFIVFRQDSLGFVKYSLKYIALVTLGVLIGALIVTRGKLSTDSSSLSTKQERYKLSPPKKEQSKINERKKDNKSGQQVNQVKPIYVGQTLSQGYDMGVNSSGEKTYWLTNMNGYMKMIYPSGQSWGAVFVTVGHPRNPPRPSQDFSSYKSLSVELRGETGLESVDIGIKDSEDPDDGSESKITIVDLTTDWKKYIFPLDEFKTADIAHLYVLIEFVFDGAEGETIYFRNIEYLKNRAIANTITDPIEIVKKTKIPAWWLAEDDTWGEVISLFPIYWSVLDPEKTDGKTLYTLYGDGRMPDVIGWNAETKPEGWLVSFTWRGRETLEGEVAGYFWVVDASGEVIPVNGNQALEKKYKIKWDRLQSKELSEIYRE